MFLSKMNFIKRLPNRTSVILRHLHSPEKGQSFISVKEIAKIDNFTAVRKKIKYSIRNPTEYKTLLAQASDLDSDCLIFAEDIRKIVALTETDEDLVILKSALLKFSSQKNVLQYDSFFFGPEIMRLLYFMDKPNEALELTSNPNLSQFFQHSVSLLLLLDLLFKNKMYGSVINVCERYKEGREQHLGIMTFLFAACYKENTQYSLKKAKAAWYSLLQSKARPTLRMRLLLTMLLINQDYCPLDILKTKDDYSHSLCNNIKCIVFAKGRRFRDVFQLIQENLHSEGANTCIMCEETLSFIEQNVQNSDEDNIVQFYSLKQKLKDKNCITYESLDTYLLGNMIMSKNFQEEKEVSQDIIMTSPEVLVLNNLEEMAKVSNYKRINFDDPRYRNYTHCSHAMIYARSKAKSLKVYDKLAIILMQIRFDGLIGFPGGGVDFGESPVEAVNREIKEESGWTEENGPITDSNYQFTHADETNKLVLHFYAVEVSESKIAEIERNSLHAADFGEEVLGNFRVPLYTMSDSYRGFPAFLGNSFVGNAKAQLLECLIKLNILPAESILKALEAKPKN